MNRPPPTLAYDDLPPGSDVRREPSADGVSLRIIVPAGEPPPAVRRRTMLDAFASAAPATAGLLLLALLLFLAGLRNNRISGVSLTWAWTFFAVFCGALVLLVAWVRFGVTLDALRAGRRQATALAATPDRLLVETAGPFGVAAYDLPAAKIRTLAVTRGPLRDDRGHARRLWRLAVALTDGRTIHLLPGRDVRELEWAAAILKRTLRVA